MGDKVTTIGFYVDLPECRACGCGHPRLPVRACDPKGPGPLRAGETHEATCPERGWKIYFREYRVPATGPRYKLFLEVDPT